MLFYCPHPNDYVDGIDTLSHERFNCRGSGFSWQPSPKGRGDFDLILLIQKPFYQSTVFVDAPVTQERPYPAHILRMPKV